MTVGTHFRDCGVTWYVGTTITGGIFVYLLPPRVVCFHRGEFYPCPRCTGRPWGHFVDPDLRVLFAPACKVSWLLNVGGRACWILALTMLVRSFTFLVSVTGILAGVDGFILFPIWCVSRGGGGMCLWVSRQWCLVACGGQDIHVSLPPASSSSTRFSSWVRRSIVGEACG